MFKNSAQLVAITLSFFVLVGCLETKKAQVSIGANGSQSGARPTPLPSGTPEATPSPISSATPIPTPEPIGTPVAVPNPQQPTTAGFCGSGNDYEGSCPAGICYCEVALSKIISGKPFSRDMVLSEIGEDDPTRVFHSGGSENIPVICRAVKYWMDNDPEWFQGYFDVQFQDPTIGLFGREIFSSTYMSQTVGAVIAVHRKAVLNQHLVLAEKSARWLKAYWAVLALQASWGSVRTDKVHHHNQDTGQDAFDEEATPRDLYGGIGLALPGNRSYVNSSSGGTGLQYIQLSLALNHPTRKYAWTLDQSPGYYGGLCATVKVSGFQFNSEGKVNLQSYDPPAQLFGLSERERGVLREFISSNGRVGLQEVVSYLQPYKLDCPLTIVRTETGLTSWFGNESDTVGLCSRSKGGSYVAGNLDFANQTATYLSRATLQNWPEEAEIFKEGEQVCEQTDRRAKKCIPLPTGPQIYKIIWPDKGSIQVY